MITAALTSVVWSLVVVLVMYLVASATSVRRVDVGAGQGVWVAFAIAAGALPVLVLSLGSGVIPFNGAGIVPIAGIVIGNMMTAATLTGRRAADELRQPLRQLRGRTGDRAAAARRGVRCRTALCA